MTQGKGDGMDDYRNTYNGAGALGAMTPAHGWRLDRGRRRQGRLRDHADRRAHLHLQHDGQRHPVGLLAVAARRQRRISEQQHRYSGATAGILYTATTSGTHYLSAGGAYSTGVGAYTLTATAGFQDDYRDTYNDATEAPLGALAPGGTQTGSIESEGDRTSSRSRSPPARPTRCA